MKICSKCKSINRNKNERCSSCNAPFDNSVEYINIENRIHKIPNNEATIDVNDKNSKLKEFTIILFRDIRSLLKYLFPIMIIILLGTLFIAVTHNRDFINFFRSPTNYESIHLKSEILNDNEKNKILSLYRNNKVTEKEFLENISTALAYEFPTYESVVLSKDKSYIYNEDMSENFSITASSTRSSNGEESFDATNLIDNNYTTAWSGNMYSNKHYETLTFTNISDQIQTFDTIYLLNGYAKDEESFNKNSSPTKIILKKGDLDWYILNLSPTSELQEIKLETDISLIPGDSFDLVIYESEPGVNDTNFYTTISEIYLDKRPFWDF